MAAELLELENLPIFLSLLEEGSEFFIDCSKVFPFIMGELGDFTFKFGPDDSMCLFPSVGAPLFAVNDAGSDRLLHGILEGKTASDEDTEFPEEAEEEDSADRLLFP